MYAGKYSVPVPWESDGLGRLIGKTRQLSAINEDLFSNSRWELGNLDLKE